MSRADFAVVLIVLLALALGAVIYRTRRYIEYRRAITRGRKNIKAVKKPFWMH